MFPYQIQLDLTDFCPKWTLIQKTGSGPKDCEHCAFPVKGISHISIEKLITVLQTFEKHGGRSVFITGGGEPGAYRHWPELLKFLSTSTLGLTMNTNGQFIGRLKSQPDEIIKAVFSESKGPAIISVSVHDQDARDAIVELNRIRARLNLPIVIRATHMVHLDTTPADIEAFIVTSRAAGADIVTFKPTHIIVNGRRAFNINQQAFEFLRHLVTQQENINKGHPELGHSYGVVIQAERLNRLAPAFEWIQKQHAAWEAAGRDPLCLAPLCNLYLNTHFRFGMCCDTKDTGIGGTPAEIFGSGVLDTPESYFVEAMWGMIKLTASHCIVGCGFMEPNIQFPQKMGLGYLVGLLTTMRDEVRAGQLMEEDAKARIRAAFKGPAETAGARVADGSRMSAAPDEVRFNPIRLRQGIRHLMLAGMTPGLLTQIQTSIDFHANQAGSQQRRSDIRQLFEVLDEQSFEDALDALDKVFGADGNPDSLLPAIDAVIKGEADNMESVHQQLNLGNIGGTLGMIAFINALEPEDARAFRRFRTDLGTHRQIVKIARSNRTRTAEQQIRRTQELQVDGRKLAAVGARWDAVYETFVKEFARTFNEEDRLKKNAVAGDLALEPFARFQGVALTQEKKLSGLIGAFFKSRIHQMSVDGYPATIVAGGVSRTLLGAPINVATAYIHPSQVAGILLATKGAQRVIRSFAD
ncbi:MAG: radical SAM protein, partial [Candidatus Omnitrophota bacterium]